MAPQGLPQGQGEAPKGVTYSQVTANEDLAIRVKRPTFETPQELRAQLIVEGTFKDRDTDMDRAKEDNFAPASAPWIPGKCLPQAPIAPKYVINSPRIEEQKQYMQDNALIGKFLGLWPSERELIKWIQYWWRPKGHYDLQLGSKGFFTIIFHNLEDRNRIFDGGPYFFNSAGLFLRFWTEKFSPKKEDFTHAPVWIRLYSLPHEFWLEEVLAGIGNTIGIYVKSSEATKQRRYTSYARICVYLNIAKLLPGSIMLEYQDEDWAQTIDYEHIPFRYRKCHEHGHLFRECPLNNMPKEGKPENAQDKEGFTQQAGRRRQGSRKQPAQVSKDPSTSNKYAILQDAPKDTPNTAHTNPPPQHTAFQPKSLEEEQPKKNKESELPSTDPLKDQHEQLEIEDGDEEMEVEEPDLVGVDLEHLEHAYRHQKLYTIPRDQLRKVHKVFLNSSAGSSARSSKALGIQISQTKTSNKAQKDEKKRGRKSTNKLIQEIESFMVNLGQIHLISDSFPPLPPPLVIMKIISWNIRGLNGRSKQKML
jgi:hypothetical protein